MSSIFGIYPIFQYFEHVEETDCYYFWKFHFFKVRYRIFNSFQYFEHIEETEWAIEECLKTDLPVILVINITIIIIIIRHNNHSHNNHGKTDLPVIL